MKWKHLLPYSSTRNVTAISDFWPPNVNEGSQNCDPANAATRNSDCWGAGEMQEARWTRKQDWPQRAEVCMKGMNSASLEACIFPYLLFSRSVVSDSLWPHELQHARLLVLYHPPELAQTCVHWVGDSVKPSHLLSSPSPAFNLSQHQGSFQISQFFPSGGQSAGVSASASVLPVNIQDWFPLGLTGLISLQSKGYSRVFSNSKAQKHQFFSTQPSLRSNSHIHTWLLEKPQLWLYRPLLAKQCVCLLICCLGWS